MTDRPIRIPGPDHPITITANPRRVVVALGGQVLADSRAALSLKEASYPAVLYVPRADVDMDRLTRSAHATYCPYKGDCAYYNLPEGAARGVNAVWTYETPFPAVEAIKGCLAFYADRVEITESE